MLHLNQHRHLCNRWRATARQKNKAGVMSDTSGNPNSQRRDSALVVETAPSAANTVLVTSDAISGESQLSQPSNVHPKRDDSSFVSMARLFQLNRGDQLLIGVTAILALGLISVQWVQLSGWGMQPVEIEQIQTRQLEYRIDINSAEWIEWVQMQGIGETLANRIIENRDQNGPFESIDDLQRVKGIGPKTVEKLRPWITVTSDEDCLAASRRRARTCHDRSFNWIGIWGVFSLGVAGRSPQSPARSKWGSRF
jgi:competence protein ComEA